MAFKLSELPVLLGSFLGNRSREIEAAAGVATATELGVVKTKATGFLSRLGSQLGSIVGSGPVSIMANAAEGSGTAAVASLEQKYLGYTMPQILLYVGGGVLLLWWMNKRSSTK